MATIHSRCTAAQYSREPCACVFAVWLREQCTTGRLSLHSVCVCVCLQGLFSQGLSVDSVRSLLLDVTASAAFHSLILGEFPAPTTRKVRRSYVGPARTTYRVPMYALLTSLLACMSWAGPSVWLEHVFTARGAVQCVCVCVCVCVQDVENELAQFGLLCTVLGMSDDAVSQGHWQPATHTNGTQGVQSQPQSDSISHSDSVGSQSDLRWIFTGQQMRLSLAQEGLYEDHVSAQVDEDFFGNFS